ncbi:related to Pheromone-regulated membrane protein 10 [Hanseniaspora guilliermondii]|uniref:Pheromone-regulated membrane protein 10 n=1 Tax=Hanseniaspora guilliermondii TaxID=56406 RepID=A0A1L0AY06_9ASCO|nr:related to Pheromone-regulated membrane protein 10 [Hanseniaspora guilliermondii]
MLPSFQNNSRESNATTNEEDVLMDDFVDAQSDINEDSLSQNPNGEEDAQIAELIAPYIANLSMKNPILYDQLIHTIDQNRILQNVNPNEDSEFEKIQQMKKEMREDLEADWNAVDPVPFLGEDPENDDSQSTNDRRSSRHSIHSDNSSKSKNKTLGSVLNKIGLGTVNEDESSTSDQFSQSNEKVTMNDNASRHTSAVKSLSSNMSKPESIGGKFASVLKKSIGLEEEYDPTAIYDMSSQESNDMMMDNQELPETRLSGDQIMASKIDDTFNKSNQPQNIRNPGLMSKFMFKYKNQNTESADKQIDENGMPRFQPSRPKEAMKYIPKKIMPPKGIKFKRGAGNSAAITVHLATLLNKQRFIIRLCKALMLYGAPTHRLEDYMKTTSSVLDMVGQFLYLPGCMIISFDNVSTTSDGGELHLIKCNQGVNLWKLHKVYKIYKLVIHDQISLEDASTEIDAILIEPNLYNKYWTIFFYAFASSMVTPFAFGGDWVNIAISFFIGMCVGILQNIVAPKSTLYSNVFEISASIVVSFCARALGSIPNSNICFGSVVQGSLALILPGYIILCGSLELQNKNLLAGSVRMIYAIIYSLFLSFGITLGAALFAWIYNNATNETTCVKNVPDLYKLIWVPVFSVLLALINQAHWTQLFVMTAISCLGYLTTYYSGKHFSNSTEFCSALAAFVIGILGNLYSRIYSGLAVSAMLPAIFVQVPSGIASKSSLLTGVNVANQIVNGSTTQVEETDSNALSFGLQMIQVAIGVTVGLFSSTIFIYPFGKQKTGLFTL